MRDWLNDRFGRSTTITREATVQTPLRLELRTSHGRVRVRGVEGTAATVRAEIDVRGFYRDDDRRIEEVVTAGIVFEAGRLRVESPASREAIQVHYELRVPFATLAELNVVSGPVEVRGIEGPVEVRLANGPLTIEDAGGAITVDMANGPLQVERCRGAVEAKVANGPIHLEDVAGPLALRVSNGPIDITDAGSSIEASAVNGPITYEGAVHGNFDMTSSRGGIVLELPPDSRFELDAEAERGEVYCDFDVKGAAGPSGTALPRVVLRTERGEILVRQASVVGVS